jgi:membrane associated rhomboid family serine protease
MFPIKDNTEKSRFPFLTFALILANIHLFVSYEMLNPDAYLKFAFVPAHPGIVNFVSSMFLHSTVLHLASNMWFLWIFGSTVEDRAGRIRFILLYLLSGVAAIIFHSIFTQYPEIPVMGASGAISGVIGAYVLLAPNSEIITQNAGFGWGSLPAYIFVSIWFLLQLGYGILSFILPYGVSFWAHIGGFICGLGLQLLMGRKP